MDFGEKLYERGSLLEADFKPVVTWTKSERREYMNRAMQNYRKKMTQNYTDKVARNIYLTQELKKLHLQQENLSNLEKILERRYSQEPTFWLDPYLMKQNEILRSEVLKYKAQSIIIGKFAMLGQYSNYFETESFQRNLDWTFKKSFKLFSEIKVTKHGKLFVFSEEYQTIPNRKKARDEINKVIKDKKVKYGNIRLKQLAVDKKKQICFWYTFKVEDVDFLEYADTVYNVWRYNKNQVCAFRDSWWDGIVYDVVDIDTRTVPFYYPPELKQVSFDFQAVSIAFLRSKGVMPCTFVITALYRNDKFAVIIKVGMAEKPDKTGFHACKNTMTCTMITRILAKERAVEVRTASQYFAQNEWIETLSAYEAIHLELKKNQF
eukprot:snap_masked-scaffold_10-processed-gene-13.35-mRNA-1 protein AED:1.00 eAED:1.00 QI:0/-1/0/0/-1/1/1/0/377